MGRVVLFGGSGFIGRHLRAHLGPEVAAPTRAELDLENADAIRHYLRSGDVVINAAGYAVATDVSPSGAARFRASNVDAVRNLVGASIDARIKQLIHVSSVAAMGRLTGAHITEGDSGPIATPYAESKRQAEKLLLTARGDIAITIVRPTSVLGEGRALAALLCRMLAAPVVPLPGGGRSPLPLTYVGNVVAAIEYCIAQPRTFGRVFIVGDRQSYPLRDVLGSLARALGRHPRFVPVPVPAARAIARGFEMVGRATGRPPLIDRVRLQTLTEGVEYSIAAFQDATGYEPLYDLDAGMTRIAALERQRRRSGS